MLLGCDFIVAPADAPALGSCLAAGRTIAKDEKVGITMANISVLKNGKAKAMRLSTLEAICKALECQPGDLLEYKNGPCF